MKIKEVQFELIEFPLHLFSINYAFNTIHCKAYDDSNAKWESIEEIVLDKNNDFISITITKREDTVLVQHTNRMEMFERCVILYLSEFDIEYDDVKKTISIQYIF